MQNSKGAARQLQCPHHLMVWNNRFLIGLPTSPKGLQRIEHHGFTVDQKGWSLCPNRWMSRAARRKSGRYWIVKVKKNSRKWTKQSVIKQKLKVWVTAFLGRKLKVCRFSAWHRNRLYRWDSLESDLIFVQSLFYHKQFFFGQMIVCAENFRIHRWGETFTKE